MWHATSDELWIKNGIQDALGFHVTHNHVGSSFVLPINLDSSVSEDVHPNTIDIQRLE